jgi:endoglucanase
VLGANSWGVSMIVGDGTVFPYCPQHQPANILGSTNGTGVIIAGAVVEGPDNAGSSGSLTAMQKCGSKSTYSAFNANGAVYEDWVQSYSTNEPAIDLTAASMLMFGWRIAGTPATLP